MKPALAPFAGALAGLILAFPFAAIAGDLTVVVKDQHGGPVVDAVVTAQYPGGKAPAHFSQPLEMNQKNLMFEPFVLVAPVGSDVRFNNEDKVRHHVYSFSPTKKFELKLFGKDQSHLIRFDKAGTVALGCNIHDNMVAFIRVVDAPLAGRTDASGRVVLHGAPAGSVTVAAWQPYLRAPDNQVVFGVSVPRSGGVEHDVTVSITAPRR